MPRLMITRPFCTATTLAGFTISMMSPTILAWNCSMAALILLPPEANDAESDHFTARVAASTSV